MSLVAGTRSLGVNMLVHSLKGVPPLPLVIKHIFSYSSNSPETVPDKLANNIAPGCPCSNPFYG